MKTIFLIPALLFCLHVKSQCDRIADSLALVALYNATDGNSWTTSSNLDNPMSSWYGVTLNGDGCVQCIDLDGDVNCSSATFNNAGNNLIGQIPAEMGNLSQIEYLSLGNNLLSGSIPAS